MTVCEKIIFPRCECVSANPVLPKEKWSQCRITASYTYKGRLVCGIHRNKIERQNDPGNKIERQNDPGNEIKFITQEQRI